MGALDNRLEDFEFGRILYHLAQRRGFLSNRKTPLKNEDKSVVKAGISELKKAIEETHSRTLGEYYSKLNPEEARIRGRWISREMYENEFKTSLFSFNASIKLLIVLYSFIMADAVILLIPGI